jgi:hypothetical protein
MKMFSAALAATLALLLASAADARGGSHSGNSTTSHSVTTPRTTTPSYVPRDARGRIERSTAAKDSFKHSNPCPSTGNSSGACPGYVIDHVTALKRGGADAPSNMQWQTIDEAKLKDKTE